MTTRLLWLATVVLVAGAACGTGTEVPPAAFSTSDDCANHQVSTFRVEGRALKDRYQVGETARVAVRVVRSLEGAAGESLPVVPDQGPVEGAGVGVGLTIGSVHLLGGSMTDEDGSTIVEIKIGKHVEPGWAVAGGRAWKDLVSDPCPITEEGVMHSPKLFRVVASR